MSFLVRPVLRTTSRRFASTIGSHAQGTQDDPSLTANLTPDFTSAQGVQGDLSKGKTNDAICSLWLEKCKLYGYNDCEERLQKLLDLNTIPKN